MTLSGSSGFDIRTREPGLDVTGPYDSSAGLGLRGGYDFEVPLSLFAEYQEDPHYGSFGGGLRLRTPTAPIRVGLSAGARFITGELTLPYFTTGLLAEVRPWRHVGIGVELDKAWPLKHEVVRLQEGSKPQRTVTLDNGPLRFVLGATWYF
ncbi:hypothetical protein D7X74_40380 [Corallococcus sp. CA047B]|nr:hypothetical protein D7X74_40380 [Corallococcus sp. CA047B]